ncbi:hypothetical protein T05_14004 [Trichinella murrelli]|uniref:Uncharacterized protein n=1 Tax=Trichinella murrelli TaxID=144512 RepID=A0A0V0U8M6_9BILA|nr:hypothetical protein T05_14004 [Trichinella murrelli]
MIITNDDLDSVKLVSSGSILFPSLRNALSSSFTTSYSMIMLMKLASCFKKLQSDKQVQSKGITVKLRTKLLLEETKCVLCSTS